MGSTKAALQALERAYAMSDAGDQIGALAWTDRALKLDAELAAAYTELGWILENLGSVRLPEARSAYERAIELDSADLWAALGLATVLTRMGSPAEAGPLYRRVVDEAPSRVAAEPDLAEALGWAQHRLGDHAAAERTFRAALERTPGDVAVRLDLGISLLVAGRPEDALAELRRAVDDAGTDQRGNLAVAIDDLEAALAEHHGLVGGDEARALLADALTSAAGSR